MKNKPKLAGILQCTGCMGCVDVCPVKAISSIWNDEGHLSVKVSYEKCIGCLKCEKFCNNYRNDYGSNDLRKSIAFAGWANDFEIRKKSTSGGIFGAIAYRFIEDGGIVVGATFDGRNCYHILISKIEDIEKLQGSKYTQSDISGIYHKIENEIENHKILFCGTGCQCAAIIEYFMNNNSFSNLYTIDLVCGGVPSRYLIDKYFEYNNDIISIESFRNKEKYELTINTLSGEKKDKTGLPITGFANEMANRYSCYNCEFAFPNRKCDLTIGDLWGNNDYEDEREKGISLIISHSKRGKLLLDKTNLTIKSISWEPILHGNRRIVSGHTHISFVRKNMRKIFNALEYKQLLKVYGMVFEKRGVIWFTSKVYKRIIYLLDMRKANKIIKKLTRGTKK